MELLLLIASTFAVLAVDSHDFPDDPEVQPLKEVKGQSEGILRQYGDTESGQYGEVYAGDTGSDLFGEIYTGDTGSGNYGDVNVGVTGSGNYGDVNVGDTGSDLFGDPPLCQFLKLAHCKETSIREQCPTLCGSGNCNKETTEQCRAEKGMCQKKCKGNQTYKLGLCGGSCYCCVGKIYGSGDCNKETTEQCRAEKGKCQKKCKGSQTYKLGLCGGSCYCCVGKIYGSGCIPKFNCRSLGGSCVPVGAHCSGRMIPGGCKGGRCNCCTPVTVNECESKGRQNSILWHKLNKGNNIISAMGEKIHKLEMMLETIYANITGKVPPQGCPEGFIMPSGSNQCFKLFPDTKVTWEMARSKCQSEGLRMAEPADDVAVTLRKYLVEKYGEQYKPLQVWLGAREIGSHYYWMSNGVAITNSSQLWYPRHPIFYSGSWCLLMQANDLYMRHQPTRPYSTQYCGVYNFVLCERPPTPPPTQTPTTTPAPIYHTTQPPVLDCSTLGGCDVNAKCILPHGSTIHICKCNVGSTGDGEVCGSDQDLDGFPDVALNCTDVHCHKDNCPTKPNSGQEDHDTNGVGDACDNTAPAVTTTAIPPCSKTLTSNCNSDSDGDGIENAVDNCPDVNSIDQTDSDGDSIGDVCDNCPAVNNTGQEDEDQDMVGDACDNNRDKDRDGIQDDIDNCPDVPNTDQLNADGDDKGNACDEDADNDGVLNLQDNCWLVHNPRQRNNDPCLNDFDDDGIENFLDNCPNNSMIAKTDFRTFQKVDLEPSNTAQPAPIWVIKNDGAEITQTENSDPGLFFGNDVLGGIDFEGTFYIEDTIDDDYAGVVFSYQSSARFYMMQWKKKYQRYWITNPFEAKGEPAITLKRVNSITGPGNALRNALWHTGSVPNQTKVLWTDPNNVGWKDNVAYRWQLLHRPQIGLIRLRVLKGATLVADSGNIFDTEIKGGRLGAFVFSQEDVIWSNLGYRCNDDVPQDSYDNLTDPLKNNVGIDHSWNWW